MIREGNSKTMENFSDTDTEKLSIGVGERLKVKYAKYKEKGWTEEEIRAEMIYDAVDGYDKNKFSEEVFKRWDEEYSDNPISFFDKENYEKIKNMPQEDRLIYLARTSHFLRVTPNMANLHFTRFPEDLEAIKIIYEKGQGYPEDALNNDLFSISALDLDRKYPELKKRFNYLNDYVNISKKRNFAPDLLLNDFDENEYIEKLKKYGKGAEGFLKLMDRAADFAENIKYPINSEYMLTEDFRAMDDRDKAEFLRECISTIQMHLVFDEVFNARFTSEGEDEVKRAVIYQTKRGDDVFNQRHSMIYKTYHPVSIYKTEQEKFDYGINNTADWGGPVEDYPYEKILLVVLRELKDTESQKSENTDTLVDFWNKNRNPLFGNAVSDALSKQNPERASSQLLKLIKEEKGDKRPLSAILYRLEFGKIGISEEGVKYLEKMYDLGEYNNSDYHVSRLTADGEMGLFDDDLKLIKYFHLGDLSNNDKNVQAKVIDFVYETLFYGKSDESPEERIKREKYLQDFKENYYKIANENIFEQTGSRLNNLSFKEQGWFVIYFNQASGESRNRLKSFVQKHGEKGIKTFLSLESDEETGEDILNIEENLKNDPEIADLLFTRYGKAADDIYNASREISKLYEEIFFEKSIDQNDISQAILKRAGNLIKETSEKLKASGKSDKAKIVNNAIEEFNKQEITLNNELEEFRKAALDLNIKYRQIDIEEENPEEYDEFFKQWLLSKEGKEVTKDFSGKILQNIEKSKKFDSQRIKRIIEEEEEKIKDYKNEEPLDFMNENIDEEKLLKLKAGMKDFYKNAINYSNSKIEQLKELLVYQVAFENKLDKLIYGQESAVLPKEALVDIEKEISAFKPEELPEKKPLYFPVGISKDLAAWREVWEGKEKMAKPIDIYGYMFWLNNQGKEAKLVICDEIQKSNYQNLYDLSEGDALAGARKIGENEKEFYDKIISTFELKNIEIMDYREFLSKDGDSFSKYKNLCERFSKNEIWTNAFLDMIQESVGGKTSKEDKEKFLPYAIEELSWILATDGTKISHPNEARYDAVAAAIKNVEKYAIENGVDIFDQQKEEKLKPFVSLIVKELRNKTNQLKEKQKNKAGQSSLEFCYYKNFHEALSKIKTGKMPNKAQKLGKVAVEFNFSSSSAGSQSFGWRKSKENKEESVMKFREPYSTYFYKDKAEMFLKSDQVIASSQGKIGGKIQAMEQKKQVEYTVKVIKPILVQYFKSLENAPEEYFSKVKKTREHLLVECKKSATLNDLLKFIQKYIVEPTSY